MKKINLFNIDFENFNYLLDNALNKNEEYKELNKKFCEIMDNYPNLQLIFEENDISFELNKTECEKLQEIIALGLEIRKIENYEIFFLGGNQAYEYFKKIGILK